MTDPLRLWMVNAHAITPDLPGGTRHYDLSTAMRQHGFETTIFASNVHLALRRSVRTITRGSHVAEDVDGVRFVWVRSREYAGNDWRRALNMISFAQNAGRAARALASDERPDLVLGSTPHPLAAYSAMRTARRLGVPFVLEVRDLWPQAIVDMGRFGDRHPGIMAMRAVERRLYRGADLVVTLAAGMRSYLVERGVAPERIVLVPNGVHLDHFQPGMTRDAARAKLGFGRFTVVYAGAHGPANALGTLVEAARRLRDRPVDVVLVGDGVSKRALVEQAAGLANVRFEPPVPKSFVPDLLQAADAAVITLRDVSAFSYAVSPNKLFDYMAAGRPVVCAVPGDMAALVETTRAGVGVRPEDAEALAQAIARMSERPEEEREAMGARGREYVAKHLDRRALAGELATALRALAERRG